MPLFNAKMAVYANGKYRSRTYVYIDPAAASAIGANNGKRFVLRRLDDEYYDILITNEGLPFRWCTDGRIGWEIAFVLGEPLMPISAVRLATKGDRILLYKGRVSLPADKPRVRVKVLSRPISWDEARTLIANAEQTPF